MTAAVWGLGLGFMWSSVAMLCLWRYIVAAQTTVGWENEADVSGMRKESDEE